MKLNNNSQKIIDILLTYAGNHASNIDATSIEHFKLKLETNLSHAEHHGEVEMVLPGFPYKSINAKEKVLGKLPDLGEQVALARLESLRVAIADILSCPVKIIICSDGQVFNDLKGIANHDVQAYRAALKWMAAQYTNIEIKGLDDFISTTRYPRDVFIEKYGLSVEAMKSKLSVDTSLRLLVDNLTTFARNDLLRETGETKSAFLLRCKETALHVAARSQGWASLVESFYPQAIRLTIHPYKDVSCKFPISLLPSLDGRWRTPWHNVPVVSLADNCNEVVALIPRKQAEKMDLALEYADAEKAQPWCFRQR
jgi:pyoverdine/dityrosine biosynthesis protein Dit1